MKKQLPGWAVLLIITLVALAVYRAVYELDAFVRQLPHALSGAADAFKRLSSRLSVFMEKLPPELSVYIDDVAAGFAAKAAQLPAELSASILRTVSSTVSAAPKIILSVATCAISVFFMSACYPDITAFILRQIPERMRDGFMDIKSHMFKTFGKWLRAQAVMCCITAAELCAAFLLMGIDYAVLLAVAIALIDALPVFGTGTVLLPWAACSLIAGNTQRALMLTATYLITLIVRNCTEPRIVGARLGLSPVATLMAMYVGFCAIGVLGMILFPILLIMLGQINDRLGKKLWK